jgi:hypothetical protein
MTLSPLFLAYLVRLTFQHQPFAANASHQQASPCSAAVGKQSSDIDPYRTSLPLS